MGNSLNGIVSNSKINGTTTTVSVSDTVVTGSGTVGIAAIVESGTTAIAKVELVRSIISNYNEGVRAESQNGTASVSIRKSMVTGSSLYGLGQLGATSIITSYGKNTLVNNTSNFFGFTTLTTAPPL